MSSAWRISKITRSRLLREAGERIFVCSVLGLLLPGTLQRVLQPEWVSIGTALEGLPGTKVSSLGERLVSIDSALWPGSPTIVVRKTTYGRLDFLFNSGQPSQGNTDTFAMWLVHFIALT